MMNPAPLITLAIETSNSSVGAGEVALGQCAPDGAGELLSLQTLTPTNRHDDALAPAINRAVREAGLTPRDLNRVAVSIGPGGFTALRIAVATAKGISLVTGARCVAVPSALVAARRAFEMDDALTRVGVMLASKRQSAWITVIDRTDPIEIQCAAACAGRAVEVAELPGIFNEQRVEAVIADAYLPEAMRQWFAAQAIPVAEPTFGAACCLEASWGLAETDSSTLTPIYPRQPEAVSNWRRLHG